MPAGNSASSLLRSPTAWLVALTIAVLTLSLLLGLWRPAFTDDTQSYVAASQKSLLGMLDDVRPPAYPIFLKVVALCSPGYALLPALQILAHCLAAWLLFFALRSYGASGWQALALSGGFLVTLVNDPAARCLMTDFPGRALTAAVVALLFLVSRPAPGRWPWVTLGDCLALSWLLRPSGIVLLLLAPPLGGLLLLLHRGEAAVSFRTACLRAGRVAALSFLPLLAFCGTRYAAVGEFGVSAFSGYQLSGLSVGLLDRDEIARDLPADMRPLALALAQERDAKGLLPVVQGGRLDVARWKKEFNVSAWEVAAPVAERMYGPSATLSGKKLRGLSSWILRRHARAYIAFVETNLGECLGGVLRYGLVLQVLLGVAFLLYAFRLSACALRAGDPGGAAVHGRNVADGFIVAALAFALVSVLLTALSAVNLGRYSIAAGILLPSCAAEWSFREAAKIGRVFGCGGSTP